MPARIHVMSVGATIDIDHRRILLRSVETDRLHHTVVEVGGAVGSLERATAILRHVVALPRIGCRQPVDALARYLDEVYLAGHVRLREDVANSHTTGAKRGIVPTLSVVEERALAVLDTHAPRVLLNR